MFFAKSGTYNFHELAQNYPAAIVDHSLPPLASPSLASIDRIIFFVMNFTFTKPCCFVEKGLKTLLKRLCNCTMNAVREGEYSEHDKYSLIG